MSNSASCQNFLLEKGNQFQQLNCLNFISKNYNEFFYYLNRTTIII